MRTCVTTFGPAWTTVTGTTRLFSSKTWVIPSLVPRIPVICLVGLEFETVVIVPSALLDVDVDADAGRSMRMSASTVLGVGSRMSMSRLCVRISKCSRESLYLCGERMTQYTFFSVGSGTGPTTRAPVRVTVSTIFRADASMASWS